MPGEAMFRYLIHSLFCMAVPPTALCGFIATAENQTNAYAVIQGMMQAAGKGGRPPTNLFEIADAFVLLQLATDRLNAPQSTIAASNAKVGEALHLVLQEFQNRIESEALKGRIWLEEMGKKRGWDIGPPPKPEDNPDDNKNQH